MTHNRLLSMFFITFILLSLNLFFYEYLQRSSLILNTQFYFVLTIAIDIPTTILVYHFYAGNAVHISQYPKFVYQLSYYLLFEYALTLVLLIRLVSC